jgi:3-isopropylmalate/(R)-2-methylmalate dehydratase small subunit
MVGEENPIRGRVYVVGDDIDTDQIIPAEHLALVPTIPDEYRKLGTYALSGLPESAYPARYAGETIVVAGKNFGCGSSREHAPIALGAAGCKAVVAASFARIFFRNCIATGELFPCESAERLVEAFRTGDEAEIDAEAGAMRNLRTGRAFRLKPLGDALPVIRAGGIFAYARATGMIPTR